MTAIHSKRVDHNNCKKARKPISIGNTGNIGRKYSFQGVPNQVGKSRKFQRVGVGGRQAPAGIEIAGG